MNTVEYEKLVAIIAHIDAASDVLYDGCTPEDEGDDMDTIADGLNVARQILNTHRLARLGNGQARPYSVSEII